MGHGPGGSQRVGNGHARGEPPLAQGAHDAAPQRWLAAKQMAQAANVQQQAFRRIGFFQAHAGTELPAPLGQLGKRQPIRERIVHFQMQRSAVGPTCSQEPLASTSGMPGLMPPGSSFQQAVAAVAKYAQQSTTRAVLLACH